MNKLAQRISYKEVPLNAHVVKSEISRSTEYDFGCRFADTCKAEKIFYADRYFWRDSKNHNAKVFIAMHPSVEKQMVEAAERSAETGSEFFIQIQSDEHVIDRSVDATDNGTNSGRSIYNLLSVAEQQEEKITERHIVILGKQEPKENVVLESQGKKIPDRYSSQLHELLSGVMAEEGDGRREKMMEILGIFTKTIQGEFGVVPVLTFAKRLLWTPDHGFADSGLDKLAALITDHGIATSNLYKGPASEYDITKPVLFHFHTHPGHPDGWTIPPSSGDSGLLGYHPFNEGSKAELSIQAVAIRLSEDRFKLFLYPYVKGDAFYKLELNRIRFGYLHEAYNITKLREMTWESPNVIGYEIGCHGATSKNEELKRMHQTFEEDIEAGTGNAPALLKQWNAIVEKMRSLLSPAEARWIAMPDWKRQLDIVSGGVIYV